jgi:hypothetical protein
MRDSRAARKRIWRNCQSRTPRGRRLTCAQTHGGCGVALEYEVERKFRETRLYQVAPMPAPVFEGDTLYAQTQVLNRRKSRSRPNMGIVEFQTTGFKQDGTVVITFRRALLVYKRGQAPQHPPPKLKP